ncbi:diacylglycerol kinase zeta-like [Labrus bergylta]|uniref:diacylglycerol kinase zeta-like n=1 Tax=Labrus bergylta TaxID=56723 RepID=UPI003313DECB
MLKEAELLVECVKNKDLKKGAAPGGSRTWREPHLEGADLTSLDSSGCRLRHHAASAGSQEMVLYILHRGETVLHRAASLCQRTICHYLVQAGASFIKTDLQDDEINQQSLAEKLKEQKMDTNPFVHLHKTLEAPQAAQPPQRPDPRPAEDDGRAHSFTIINYFN